MDRQRQGRANGWHSGVEELYISLSEQHALKVSAYLDAGIMSLFVIRLCLCLSLSGDG